MGVPSLGDRIREKRTELGMSLRHLADRVDKSHSFISDIENGRRFPSDLVLANIANALRADLKYLRQYDIRPLRVFTELRQFAKNDLLWLSTLNLLVEMIKEGTATSDLILGELIKLRSTGGKSE